MIVQEIAIPPHADLAALPAQVEAACAALGLHSTLRDTLAAYPGSVHWHYKQDRTPGTLEITFWPAARRLWAKIAAGRAGTWAANLLPHLTLTLEAALAAPSIKAPTQHATRNT